MGQMEILVKKGLAMKRKSKLTGAIATVTLAVLTTTGFLHAGQVLAEIAERNCVLRLQGIRGLAVVSSARTDEVLKVIVAKAHISESRCGHRLWLSQKEGLPDCAGWLRR
jgi:hypothetical protein